MRLGVRQKLVLLSLLILVVVSSGFTTLQLAMSRAWVEEDLEERAVAFAREIAATISDERELTSGSALESQIRQILAARPSIQHLDVLALDPGAARTVASSHPATRLPFTHRDADAVRGGQVVSRLIEDAGGRAWEVMAPVWIHGAVRGAVAARSSLERADVLAGRIRAWAIVLTAVSVVTMAALMGLAVHLVVTRPLRRFLDAIDRIRAGEADASVILTTRDELGVLATHFNEMVARLQGFNDELQRRVAAATAELDRRYREVTHLNEVLYGLQRTLAQTERLALAGRLMAEVAHEVGTPLHSIAGHLELLRAELPPAALAGDVGRRLAVVDGQVARVIEIITQLLDLTRRPPAVPEAVDVAGLVGETVELVRPALVRAGLVLARETAAGGPLPRVVGHRGQLTQVVLNLLTNAIDATPPGGRIGVAIRWQPEASAVAVEVADTGRGIRAEDRERIFEPFFSTKAAGRGTGLGLCVAAQIARDHRGWIEVESEPGRGSRFRLVLPVPAAVEAAVATPAGAATA